MLWAKRIEELKVELATVKARLAEAEDQLGQSTVLPLLKQRNEAQKECLNLRWLTAMQGARLAEAEGLLQLIMERTLRIDVGVWQVSWSGNLLDDMMNSLSPHPTQPSDKVLVRRDDLTLILDDWLDDKWNVLSESINAVNSLRTALKGKEIPEPEGVE